MALINDLKLICDLLGPRGWRTRLLAVTNNALDIMQPTAAALEAELAKPVQLVPNQVGFEDLASRGDQAIEAGSPALSLLYHALASPAVHPTPNGEPSGNPADYPSLAQLDTVENYIYSLNAGNINLTGLEVAVFAYQYRVGSRSTHRVHADMAFSRTGVARVGTAAAEYDPSRRGFWIEPAGGTGLPVLPARYGVFLCRRGRAGSAGSVLGVPTTDPRGFLFPVHKLFDGTECLPGLNLTVRFDEFHRNEKLRRLHRLPPSSGGLPLPAGFDVDRAPYMRDSANGGNLVNLQSTGATILVVPVPGPSLVQVARQTPAGGGSDRIAHFRVPPPLDLNSDGRIDNRFWRSSLAVPTFRRRERLAPEYVNMRHQVDVANQTVTDLGNASEADFDAKIRQGGYDAAHFIDHTCDGSVEAKVSGLPGSLRVHAAFSLVTAPDFFPLADQTELDDVRTIGNTAPLSGGDLPVNPTLPLASEPETMAFGARETTLTAVVGAPTLAPPRTRGFEANLQVSWLPDGASDVFFPGWDTSRSADHVGDYLTSSGLGSPFPEDAKLCAALGSFWPAVAPDNGRTFGNVNVPGSSALDNNLPMQDSELGLHPNHPDVVAGRAASRRGWDGEFGPFFETIGGQEFVNFVEPFRSDYVTNALNNQMGLEQTANIQSEFLAERHRALRSCWATAHVPETATLVVFEWVPDWAAVNPGDLRVSGGGYRFEFVDLRGQRTLTNDPRRTRQPVALKYECHYSFNGMAFRRGGGNFQFSR